MTDRLNIISIYCNVFLDIIDHSKKPTSGQIVFRNHINDLISIAFKYIGETDRIILNTGNGAAIAYMGSPEDAMFMAMDIRRGVLKANKHGSAPLSVCIGIHLEPVLLIDDINEQPNIIGDGINAAKRIMSHAKPNEILVSRSYYENTPPSTQALSTLFNDSGIKHEDHIVDYQAYLARLNQDQAVIANQSSTLDPPLTSMESLKSFESSGFLNIASWKYAVASLFIIIVLFAIVKLTIAPPEPANDDLMPNKMVKNLSLKESKSSNLNSLATKPNITLKEGNVSGKDNALMQERLEQNNTVKANLTKKEVRQKTKSRVDSPSTKNKTKEIISWKILKSSIKQGQKSKCTQSEIAMRQCD